MKTIKLSSLAMALGCTMWLNAATITVAPGNGTIKSAVAKAAAGDVIVLADGEYTETGSITINNKLTLKAAADATPVLKMSSRFTVETDATFDGLTFDGGKTSAEAIRYTKTGSQHIFNCSFTGFTSRTIRVYTGANLDSLKIDGCTFRDMNARVFTAEAPNMLKYLGLTRSTLVDIRQSADQKYFIYMNYGESSADGTRVDIDHCTFYNCIDRRGAYFYNVNDVHVTNCIAAYSEPVDDTKSFAVYGNKSEISHTISYNVSVYGDAAKTAVSNQNPYFVDAEHGNFQLAKNSPAVGSATDGSNLGDPRWGVSDKNADPSQLPYTLYKVPYSMSPTTSSVRILWQTTDTVSMGQVRYGTSPDKLDKTLASRNGWYVEGEGYVHIVELTGLQPFTRYYYSVGDGKREDKTISSCKTAPLKNTAFRIFMISDIHENSCKNWQNEQTFITETLNPDFAMFIGDFVNHGWERAWNESFFNPGKPFLGQVTFSGAIGNHETYLRDEVHPAGFTNYHTYYDYFSSFSHGESEGPVIDPRGEAYFTFNYGDAQIICLNLNNNFDAVYDSPSFAKGSKQYKWLENQLKNSTSKWILIYAHVGITTSGYHGQWNEENHNIIRPLLETYAKQSKHIICFAGDDHSFEHAQKDGINYVRPGCGRNANYSQVTTLPDAAYTLMYRKVSCFSTIDMAADGNTIELNAYDSVGTKFYSYTFSLSDKPLPSVYISQPNSATGALTDSVVIRYSVSSTTPATVSLFYTTEDTPQNGTLIAKDLSGTNGMHAYTWNVRHLTPKGTHYIYASITNADTTICKMAAAPVVLISDTVAPPAPTRLAYAREGEQLTLSWWNPTHLIHRERVLATFADGLDNAFQAIDDAEEGSASLSLVEGRNGGKAVQIDYTVAKAWGQGAAAYIFPEPADLSDTYTLDFWYKGDGSNNSLRLVVYNDINGNNAVADNGDDWWFDESILLKNKTWTHVSIDMRTFASFDWHSNSESHNACQKVKGIHFIIPSASACTGSIAITDIRLGGEVFPAPDYAGTVIVRKQDAAPESISDGDVVYEGNKETCIDKTLDVTKPCYYAAFAYDDLHNYSSAATLYYDPQVPFTAINNTAITATPRKILHNGEVLIVSGNKVYSTLGIHRELMAK